MPMRIRKICKKEKINSTHSRESYHPNKGKPNKKLYVMEQDKTKMLQNDIQKSKNFINPAVYK